MPLYAITVINDYRIGVITKVPNTPVVKASEIKWHMGRRSCLMAIQTDDPQTVSEL
jgi:hypothetical protein